MGSDNDYFSKKAPYEQQQENFILELRKKKKNCGVILQRRVKYLSKINEKTWFYLKMISVMVHFNLGIVLFIVFSTYYHYTKNITTGKFCYTKIRGWVMILRYSWNKVHLCEYFYDFRMNNPVTFHDGKCMKRANWYVSY